MENKVIRRADGSTLNIGGSIFCAAPKGTQKFKSSLNSLPKKVDLRDKMTAVENQGNVNSCTANAVAGAYEYQVKATQGLDYDVSRLFIYYNARDMYKQEYGGKIQDEGSAICFAIDGLKQMGACSEDAWEYSEAKNIVNKKPNAAAYSEAEQFKITSAECLDVDLNTWKQALAEGHPIIFGLTLFQSFDQQRRPGYIPSPTKNDVGRGSHGSHAMLCVGYSDPDKAFIVRNSWGTNWGDEGYCYIPYDYMMNEDYNMGDSWVIYSMDPIPEDAAQEAWDDSEESVMMDTSDAFSDMDDDTWNEMLDEMGDYGVPFRLGALYATVCCMDENMSEEEQEAATDKLKTMLKYFGIKMNAKKVLMNCMDLASEGDFLEDTIRIFGEYLSDPAKLAILNDMQEIAGADELDDEEATFINDMAEIWDIDPDTVAPEFDEDYDEDWDFEDDEDSLTNTLQEMDEEDLDALTEACEDISLPERIVSLYAMVVNDLEGDEDVALMLTQEVVDLFELDEETTAEDLLESCGEMDEDDQEETIEIFGQYMSQDVLNSLMVNCYAIAPEDDEDAEIALEELFEDWIEDEDDEEEED